MFRKSKNGKGFIGRKTRVLIDNHENLKNGKEFIGSKTRDLTIKSSRLNHITASFSKMVSPSDLILSDHVTISLFPIKF